MERLFAPLAIVSIKARADKDADTMVSVEARNPGRWLEEMKKTSLWAGSRIEVIRTKS